MDKMETISTSFPYSGVKIRKSKVRLGFTSLSFDLPFLYFLFLYKVNNILYKGGGYKRGKGES